MREVVWSSAIKREARLLAKQGKKLEKLESIIKSLVAGTKLPAKLRDHALTGKYKGFRDLHVEPDWVLVYQVDDDAVYLYRMGSHSDLFKK